MKYVKMIGLAVVAATAVMAFVGAGSASATVLCTENVSPCSVSHKEGGKKYAVGDIIKATAENPVLTASPEVTCKHSETELKITNAGSATTTVTGEITKLTFSECVAHVFGGTVGCTVSTVGLPYHAETHATTKPNGTLTVKAHAGGSEPSAEVICSGFLECKFGNTLFTLPITGGNPATITASEVVLNNKSGFLCPASAKWDAKYKATGTNTAIFVEAS